jgi:hypothetical protein
MKTVVLTETMPPKFTAVSQSKTKIVGGFLTQEKLQKIQTEEYECSVKDISLAEWGRKEINLAQVEMPGLMELRK